MHSGELLAALRAPPPREPSVAAAIAVALRPPVRVVTTAGSATTVAAIAFLAGHPLVAAGAYVASFGWLGAESWRLRRSRMRLARDGVLIAAEVTARGLDPRKVAGKVLRPTPRELIARFSLAGAPTSARARVADAAFELVGPAWVLSLPDARPRWVHVIGPRGALPFELDPIELPDAKLLRR